MQSVIGALRVNLGIDSAQFTDGLNRAQNSLGRVGRNMKRIGRSLSVSLTAPLVGFGALVTKTAGDFEAGMNRVRAVSGATEKDMVALSNQAKELGRTTQFSASQAAEAMGFLAQAGFDANGIIGAMPGTLQLAAAAQMELGDAADIVSNVLTGYRFEVSELARVNDVLVKAFTSSNTDLRQLGEAMKYVGPVASAAGVDFEEAAAALGLMGNAGIQASMAGTSLRGAISRILDPTKEAAGIIKDLGLTFTDSSGRLLPLSQIIQELAPHAQDAGLFMALFGQRAGPAMAALVGQGTAALTDLTAELKNSGGTAARIAGIQMEGFNGALKALASAFEGLQIAIASSGLLDFMTDMVKGLTEIVQSLAEASPAVLKFGTIAAGVAATIGPAVLALGIFSAALGAITAPILLAVAGVTALTVAIAGFFTLKSGESDFNKALAATAEGAPRVTGLIEDLEVAQRAYEKAIRDTAGSQNAATLSIVKDTRKEFEAKKELLNLELKRKKAALEAALAEKAEVKEDIASRPAFERLQGQGQELETAANRRIDSRISALKAQVTALGEAASETFEVTAPGGSSSIPDPLEEALKEKEILSRLIKQRTSSDGSGSGGGVSGSADGGGRSLRKIKFDLEEFSDALQDIDTQVDLTTLNISNRFSTAFRGVLAEGKSLSDSLRQVFAGIAADLGGKLIQNALNPVLSGLGGAIFGGLKIPGFANGTNNAPGGLAIVGERGREIVDLNPGARVLPNSQTESLLKGGGAQEVNLNVNVTGARGNQEIMTMVGSGISAALGEYDRMFNTKVFAAVDDPYRR